MAGQQQRALVRRLFTRPQKGEPGADGATTGPLEIAIAVLLGIAAIATAFAAYQTDLYDGDTLKAFQEGQVKVQDANQQFLEGNQIITADAALFISFAQAVQRDETELARYIREDLMEDELDKATEEWIKSQDTDQPLASPLDTETYADSIAQYAEARKLTGQFEARFREANRLDETGDRYTLATVLLAIALFFGGVAGVTRSWGISVALTSFTAIIVAASIVYMITI